MNSTHTLSERAIERGIEAAIRRELGDLSADIATAWGPATVPPLPGDGAPTTIRIFVRPPSARTRDVYEARIEVETWVACDRDGQIFATAFDAVRTALVGWHEDPSRVGEDSACWDLPAPEIDWSDVRMDAQRSIAAYVSFDLGSYLR